MVSYQEPPEDKGELIDKLREIVDSGWFHTREQDADGKVGNTLEDILSIDENNISLPDVGEYELKTQRRRSTSFVTLFHYEPFPRPSPVGQVLLPEYGWQHEEHPEENSFRVTISGDTWTARGFRVNVDREDERIYLEFDKDKIRVPDIKHGMEWVKSIPDELEPRPYWDFQDIREKASNKLTNTVFVYAKSRKQGSAEEFKYEEIELWEDFDFESFLTAIEKGNVKVDFDAKTTHNHGTKFRVRKDQKDRFYDEVIKLSSES